MSGGMGVSLLLTTPAVVDRTEKCMLKTDTLLSSGERKRSHWLSISAVFPQHGAFQLSVLQNQIGSFKKITDD